MDITKRIKQRLLEESDKKYQKFASALVPNIDNLLGVRLPVLRKIAKEIYKDDWQEFLNSEAEYMEETMLKGMVIGLIKDNPINYIADFIPQINCWSVCDTFCCGLKFTSSNKELMWEFIKKYTESNNEYEIRFALVMFLSYYMEERYLDTIFELIEKCNLEKYYAHMGAAWLISICFIKFPNESLDFLNRTKLDSKTYNKSIQKIIESYRVDNSTKATLRKMKRND